MVQLAVMTFVTPSLFMAASMRFGPRLEQKRLYLSQNVLHALTCLA